MSGRRWFLVVKGCKCNFFKFHFDHSVGIWDYPVSVTGINPWGGAMMPPPTPPPKKKDGCQETSGLACLAKTGMSLPTWSATAAPALRNLPQKKSTNSKKVEWKVNLSGKSSSKKFRTSAGAMKWSCWLFSNEKFGLQSQTFEKKKHTASDDSEGPQSSWLHSYQIQPSSPSTEVETKSPKCVYSGWCPAVRSCLSLVHVIQEQDSHERNAKSHFLLEEKTVSPTVITNRDR